MTQRNWDDDEALLSGLAEAVKDTAALSPRIAHLGREAFSWRTVDEDLILAGLSFDSSLESLGAMRSPEGSRVLVFSSSPLSVELELMADRIVGQIIPPDAGEVFVETATGATLTVEADDLGFFIIPSLPAGAVRLRCDTLSARLITDWVRI